MAIVSRVLTFCVALAAAGCLFSIGPLTMNPGAGGKRGSPPPHAPAHGARHHHPADGMVLRFDAELGVYAVVDLPHYYYSEGLYLRREAKGWRASTHLDGPWETRSEGAIPPGLRSGYARPGQNHRDAVPAAPAR